MSVSTNSRAESSAINRKPNLQAGSLLGKPFIWLQERLRMNYNGYHVPWAEQRALLIGADVLLVAAAIWGAYLSMEIGSGTLPTLAALRTQWYWLPALLGGWWVLAGLTDLYDIRTSTDKVANIVRLGLMGAMALSACGMLRYLLPDLLPYRFVLSFVVISVSIVSIWRILYPSVAKSITSPHRVLIVGTGERGRSIATVLQKVSAPNYLVEGFVIAHEDAQPIQRISSAPILGQITKLRQLVRKHRVHEIVVATEEDISAKLFEQLVTYQGRGVQVSWMPDLYEKLQRRVPIQHIDPTWALYSMQGQPIFNRMQMLGKRLLDLLIVLGSVPTLVLLMPFVALAVRLDSPGPVFYKQIRSGRGGRPFAIYKFRTMVKDAEQEGKPQWATTNDMRITRVGGFLRKTRLDEIPQILNIFKGDMSIVGPRPERPEFVEELQQEIPFYRTRLMVKPGLTGWAQVHYDYGNTVEDALYKLQYDFYYIRYWSLWLDLYTIFKTFSVVLKLKGT